MALVFYLLCYFVMAYRTLAVFFSILCTCNSFIYNPVTILMSCTLKNCTADYFFAILTCNYFQTIFSTCCSCFHSFCMFMFTCYSNTTSCNLYGNCFFINIRYISCILSISACNIQLCCSYSSFI